MNTLTPAAAFLEFLKSLGSNNRTNEELGFIRQIDESINKKTKNGTQLDNVFCSLVDAILMKNPVHANKQDTNGFTMLHHASLLGYLKLVKLLLSRGASTAIEDSNGVPPLAYAERGNHQDVVSVLLEPPIAKVTAEGQATETLKEIQVIKGLIQRKDTHALEAAIRPEIVNAEDRAGTTLLQVASFLGNLSAMRLLVSKGANLNSKDHENATCLHKAVIGGHGKCVKFLLDNGAKIDVPDSDGLTPLHHAAYYGKANIAKVLIDKGANPNAKDNEQSTPLHHAVASGNVEIVEYFLRNQGNPAAQDIKGATPLHIAAYENNLKIVQILLRDSKGVSNTKDNEGLTPLHHSCFLGFEDVSKALIDTKLVDVNDQDHSGSTPLHKACFYGHINCVKLLIANKAKVVFPNGTTSPLHHAAYGGHLECVEILLSKGAKVNCIDSEKATPLHKAAYSGHIGTVNRLLASGADVSVQDEEGSTALHKAAFSGQDKVLEALLGHGAEVDCQDLDDGTPLHNACFNGHVECVRILLVNQANLNCPDDKGASPLHLSVLNGHRDVAALLVESGAQTESPDDRGMTAMHHGIAHEHCLAFLLDRGAEIDVRDSLGRTPLFYASKNSCEEPARFLIVKGADIHAKDSNGHDPMDVASASFRKVMMNAIKEKEQQVDSETQKRYQSAVKLFNQKPKKGIEYLIEHEIIEGLPEEIVKFLHTAENLDRNKIGDLLGEPDEYSVRLLDLFVEYMDFTGLDFDDALRHFLYKFTLPGEAQKIDRIMERFAKQYAKHNPDVFPHEDTAYVLAFSLIMLNTDLHSPHIKSKMTKEGFFKNNTGVVGMEKLPRSFFDGLYDKIRDNEIKMETDTSIFGSAEKKGWCKKQGGRIRTWKKRWFVLKNNCLYYFKHELDKDPCGIIPLENILVRNVEMKGHKNVFELHSQTGEIKACKLENGQLVKGHHDTYLISAESLIELESWISAIRSNIAFNPLYEIIKKRMDEGKGRTEMTFNELKYVNFQELHDSCLMCSMAYKSPSAIKEAYGPQTVVIEDSERAMRYFLVTSDRTKSQALVFSGSLPDSITAVGPSAVSRPIDVFSAFSFDKAADYIDGSLMKHLKKDYSISIYGHSLGASLAVLFGSHLIAGGYKVEKVITFGQPKIVKEKEVTNYRNLPLTRVVDYFDPTPILFPGYAHVGSEIVLFPEQLYSTSKDHSEDMSANRHFDFNHCESYLRNLTKKLKSPLQIPFDERKRYLARISKENNF